MANDEVRPALTVAEWADGAHEIHAGIVVMDDGGATTIELPDNRALSIVGSHRHAVAALCLHKQPFGFTVEDVALLSEAAGRIEGEDHAQGPLAEALMVLGERIAALLPEPV